MQQGRAAVGAIYLGNRQHKCPGGLEGSAGTAGQGEGSCLSADLQSLAVCPSFPELRIYLDTCSEFRNKHIQWNSYFMRLLLGAYCKRND